MGDLIIHALERHPDRVAFTDGRSEVTYRECALSIGRAIQILQSLGLQRGDAVVQLSTNRPETFFVMAAAYIAGFRSVMLHSAGSEDDAAYIIADCDARCFIFDPIYETQATALANRFSSLFVLCHDEYKSHRAFWATAADMVSAPLLCDLGAEDIVRLAYTGGTTGKPKGVMLSNRAIVTNVQLAMSAIDWTERPRFLCCAPISHGGGSFIYPTLLKGGTFYLQRGFSCDDFIDAIIEYPCDSAFLVPTMIYRLLDDPRSRKVDWSGMRTLIYGGAPVSPARLKEALDVFGPVLVQTYGQTEAPNAILTLSKAEHISDDERRLHSAGLPYPGIRVTLRDDNGDEVARGETGEICVRGPLLMSGYWRQPELTAEAFRDGWLHTGDMAYQDDLGYFHLVDRKKDVIISGGFNIYPKEIEDILTAHPAISAAAVIGIPDPVWGEAVKAIVVIRDGFTAHASELVDQVKTRKGVIHAPKTVDFVSGIPVTPLGKPDKKALRANYWKQASRNVN